MMYQEGAFGISGNLTSDVLNICKQMQLDAMVLKVDQGFSPNGRPPSSYLFGGSSGAKPVVVEIVLRTTTIDELKPKLVDLLKKGKDNGVFYEIPLEAHVFNPDNLS